MTPPDHDLSAWAHGHAFDSGNRSGEARTRVVLAVTLITMVAEIVGGWWTGSMALLADGWHMGTHSLALGVAAAAYALARRHAGDPRYAFGTWKIEILGGFASALVLALVAVAITFESALRLWRAEPIAAGPALWVAVIGLLVNLLSAWLLHGADGHAGEGDDGHGHAHGHHGHGHGHHAQSDGKQQPHSRAQGHGHGHSHGHDHAHHPARGDAAASAKPASGQDLNLRAAYVHVLADALTSVLAIAALCAALWLGWWWLDPLVGVLGAVVIGVWAFGLLGETGAVLLDREMDHPLTVQIREAIESDADARVADLHLWRVGRQHHAVIVSVVAAVPLSPADYRARLAAYPSLVHVSVEVNRRPGAADTPA